MPYKIINIIGDYAYRLEVPELTRWHNVVHNTQLKLFKRRDEPQDMNEDEPEVWEVAEIVNSITVKGVAQYRVRWQGCTEFEDIWETTDHPHNCANMVKKLRQKFLSKSRDEQEA